MIIIYKIAFNDPNGSVYIGQTQDLTYRAIKHRNKLRRGDANRNMQALHNAGYTFEISQIDICEDLIADYIEFAWTRAIGTLNLLVQVHPWYQEIEPLIYQKAAEIIGGQPGPIDVISSDVYKQGVLDAVQEFYLENEKEAWYAHFGNRQWNREEYLEFQREMMKAHWADPEKREAHSMAIKESMASDRFRKWRSEASTAIWKNEDTKAKMIAATTASNRTEKRRGESRDNFLKLWADPEYKARVVEKIRAAHDSLSYRQKMSEISSALWADPDFRETMKGVFSNPETRRKMSESAKARGANRTGFTQSDETKELIAQATTRYFSNPENRQARSDNQKALWQNPEYRERMLASLIERSSAPQTEEHKAAISAGLKAYLSDPEKKAARVAQLVSTWTDERKAKVAERAAKKREEKAANAIPVLPGQVWQDNDTRNGIRQVTILSVDSEHATVQGKMTVKVALWRFQTKGRTGFTLIK